MPQLNLKIITPERLILEEMVDQDISLGRLICRHFFCSIEI